MIITPKKISNDDSFEKTKHSYFRAYWETGNSTHGSFSTWNPPHEKLFSLHPKYETTSPGMNISKYPENLQERPVHIHFRNRVDTGYDENIVTSQIPVAPT